MAIHFGDRLRPRRSVIRGIIDPERRLPGVTLAVDAAVTERYTLLADRRPDLDIHPYAILHRRSPAGEAVIAEDTTTGAIQFANIGLNETYLNQGGRGVGMAAYLIAIEAAHNAGRDFTCGPTITPSAKRIWDKFIQLEAARVEEPFELVQGSGDGVNSGYYIGRVHIPPLHR